MKTDGVLMAPAMILVRPQMGENIGAAARAMMNFGLSDLRLVAPRDGWPNEKAWHMAGHATPILEGAGIYPDLAAAVADIGWLYATTARGRELFKLIHLPAQAMAECADKSNNSTACGILFGPERTGLTNEDLALCDAVISIPTAPDHASLNIAQSLVILAYEWFSATLKSSPACGWGKGGGEFLGGATTSAAASAVVQKLSPAAQKAEIQGFFDHLEAELDASDFFKVPAKKPKMWLNIRNLFLRAALTEQEVRTLRGIIRSLRGA